MNFARALAAFILIGAIFNCPSFGREICYLTNGFQIEGVSHTIDHGRLILKTATGSMEFPLAEVTKTEEVADLDSAAATISLSTQQALQKAAEAEGLPVAFVRSVAKTESAYNPDAVSVKGALGLMQLMPATASELGVKPAVAEENALGGAKYLRDLLLRYNGNAVLALAAYNAGPAAVSRFGGVPPYAETRHYIQRVLREYSQQQRRQTRETVNPSLAETPVKTSAKRPSATN